MSEYNVPIKEGFFILDNGYPVHIGIPKNVEKVPIFDLKIGDKIKQIGLKSKGMKALNRVDTFTEFGIYIGIIKNIKLFTNNIKSDFLLFEIYPNRIDNHPVHLMYGFGKVNGELFVPDIKNKTIRIFKTYFQKIQPKQLSLFENEQDTGANITED